MMIRSVYYDLKMFTYIHGCRRYILKTTLHDHMFPSLFGGYIFSYRDHLAEEILSVRAL